MSQPKRSGAARGPALLRAAAPSWFPPGRPQALQPRSGASYPAPVLVALRPCHQPTGPDGLLPAPPAHRWAPQFIILQPESVRRGLAPRAPLPTAQESASLLQTAQQPAPKHSSLHVWAAGGDKRRVALVPQPCLAAGAKRPLPDSGDGGGPPPKAQGLGSQLPKVRVPSGQAPTTACSLLPTPVPFGPPVQSFQKPVLPEEGGYKVSALTRPRECLQVCLSSREATEKTLQEEEEKTCQQSASQRTGRRAAGAGTFPFPTLRGLAPGPGPGPGPCPPGTQDVDPGATLAAQTCPSLERPHSPHGEDPRKGAALYQRLKEHLLTQAQLKECGYPFAHPERPGDAVLFGAQDQPPPDPSRRRCCRCGAQYLVVAPSGRGARPEPCHYHWGRLRPTPAAAGGGWEIRYECCSAAIGSPGCQVAKQHVRDGRGEDLRGFVQTSARDPAPGAHPGVYALDCEMCYTAAGLELARVTVVDSALRVVLDTFVRPQRLVVDHNTRFSGVTAAHLARTRVSLRDVQAALLRLFSADTILIGHSLHGDLLALKLVHGAVLDTSVLFPHRLGLPFRRSLRSLAARYLGQRIQHGAQGHSSREDARACMQLVLWKMGQDIQAQGSPPRPLKDVTLNSETALRSHLSLAPHV